MSAEHRVQQVEAISNGTVIDHIPADSTLKVARLLAGPDDQVFIGVNLRSSKMGNKGVVKIAHRELTPVIISRLAIVAPSATMVIIRNYQVVDKSTIPVPTELTGICACPNPNCITNYEPCQTRFEVCQPNPLELRCEYCERRFESSELVV